MTRPTARASPLRASRRSQSIACIDVDAAARLSDPDAPRRDPRAALGRLGEELAAGYLQGLGFRVLERNVRTGRGEIDLVAFDGHTLAFVEVKTRRVPRRRANALEREPPLASLSPRQRARLRRLSAAWLAREDRRRPFAQSIRFDAIGVTIDGRGALRSLEHIPGAW
jgi:putative endonuclease